MSERLPTQATALMVAAASLAAGMVISRLTTSEDTGPFADTVQLERCLDSPINEPIPPPRGPKKVNIQVHNRIAEGDPIEPSKKTIKATGPTVVQIARTSTPDKPNATLEAKGTGFIVEPAEASERRFVVTNAHVIGGTTLRQLTILTADGHPIKPTGGCYVFNKGNHPINLDPTQKTAHASVDVAILSLPPNDRLTTLGVEPLRFATEAPQAGERVDFVTFQGKHIPANTTSPVPGAIQYPATYTGLVAPHSPHEFNYSVITGDHAAQQPNGESDRVEPGASGSPVLDHENGTVIGMVYAGQDDLKPWGGLLGPTLKDYGVSYFPKEAVHPNVGHLIPAKILAKIVATADTTLP